MRVLRRSGPRVVSLSPFIRGGVGGVKYCWNRFSSILSLETGSQFFLCVAFQKKIIHFQKCVFLRVLLATLIMVVMS